MATKKFSAAAAGAAALLVLSGCGGGDRAGSGADAAPAGEPVSGGHAKVIQISEPRGLAPGLLGNVFATNPLLGNAIYGTLFVDNTETGELEYELAKNFSTDDAGATFTLKLREGVTFSDGTPFDAEAVKFNWDLLKDPAVGGSAATDARMVAESTVVDATTLKLTLAEPVNNFPQSVITTPMNWIGSPAALKAGTSNEAPVGAGPFLLESWARQNVIELVRNDKYYDAPKPYLDRISIRTANDTNQRYNTLVSGGADLISEGNWATLAKGEAAGLQTQTVEFSGGIYIAMNTTKAPFNDVRARQALAFALDLELINSAAYEGEGKVPVTFFQESSPFFSDEVFLEHDPKRAQELFDELAAEGKPVSFTFKILPTAENKAVAGSVQSQLSAMKNVTANVQTIDFAESGAVHKARDFEVTNVSAAFKDPEPRLMLSFHSKSGSNTSGISDAKLDAALEKGRKAQSDKERGEAYTTVQDRLQDLVPGIFYGRSTPSVIANKNVGGVKLYGVGSPLPEELWLTK
jgi:peptide/nickel transport system substrate-binding protein